MIVTCYHGFECGGFILHVCYVDVISSLRKVALELMEQHLDIDTIEVENLVCTDKPLFRKWMWQWPTD